MCQSQWQIAKNEKNKKKQTKRTCEAATSMNTRGRGE
jgi:hypothetical protein